MLLAQAMGKTTLMNQVVAHALEKTTEMVPILIKVQQLQRRMVEARDVFASAWNYIDAFLRLEYEASHAALYRMLRQALTTRRALLLLDGLDEGGRLRDEIERHVTEVLAPQGLIMLITSRPNGITEQRFKGFAKLGERSTHALARRMHLPGVARVHPHLVTGCACGSHATCRAGTDDGCTAGGGCDAALGSGESGRAAALLARHRAD